MASRPRAKAGPQKNREDEMFRKVKMRSKQEDLEHARDLVSNGGIWRVTCMREQYSSKKYDTAHLRIALEKCFNHSHSRNVTQLSDVQ